MTEIGSLVRSVNPVSAGQTLLADDELDDLLVLINERNEGTNVEEQVMRVQPVKPRRRGWLVAVAAVAVVLVVLAPMLLLVGGTEPEVGGTAPDVAATPLEVAGGWTRVPHDETAFGGVGDQVMWRVTVGGPGLVAVGWDGPDAAVWISLDGIDWLRVPHDDALFGGASIFDVTVGGPGLVAVGKIETGDTRPGYSGDAAVWTSADGITWSRVPHDEAAFGGADFQDMRSVTAGGPGLVAVGAHGVGPGHNHALVWTSVDGIIWSRVRYDHAVFGASEMEAVTVGGPGLVAVGTAFDDDDELVAAAWTSVDGITWSRVPHDEAVFGGGPMRDVTVGGPGLVAVGDTSSENGTDAVVWTSVDGITWSRVPHDEAVFGEDRTMHSVTARGPSLVAVGETHVPSLAAVWISDDGVTWSAVPHDEAVFGQANMYSATVAGSGLVAVGVNESSGIDAGVWIWDE